MLPKSFENLMTYFRSFLPLLFFRSVCSSCFEPAPPVIFIRQKFFSPPHAPVQSDWNLSDFFWVRGMLFHFSCFRFNPNNVVFVSSVLTQSNVNHRNFLSLLRRRVAAQISPPGTPIFSHYSLLNSFRTDLFRRLPVLSSFFQNLLRGISWVYTRELEVWKTQYGGPHPPGLQGEGGGSQFNHPACQKGKMSRGRKPKQQETCVASAK